MKAAGRKQWRELTCARGYLSQSELVLTFGLGRAIAIERVTIYWPGQAAPQTLPGLAIDREHHLHQPTP